MVGMLVSKLKLKTLTTNLGMAQTLLDPKEDQSSMAQALFDPKRDHTPNSMTTLILLFIYIFIYPQPLDKYPK